MAKPRKQKNEEQKVDNSEAVVRHQKLCLSIELEKRRIYGFTELEVVVPENGIVGLHADNLIIERVTVDEEPADFEVFPHYQHLDTDNRWCSVSTANSAADAAGSVYLSCLERELVPNLLIMCSKSIKLVTEQQEQTQIEIGTQLSSESKQNVRVVHIDYWVEKAETGIHIDDNVLHTDNQIRRARCWFPCMDDSSQRCSFDLEFTVANNLVAASTGTLLYQVLSKDDPPRKTFVYKLCVPVAARWISLAVAPFEIFPDRHNGLISHICMPANLAKLQNTVGFLHSAYSHYEHYLSTKFPFGSYTQVFIAPEMAISSLSLGASMNIYSSQILYDEKIIDQTINTRIKLAYGLARQWFGVYIIAETPNDEWLLDGLAGFLTDSFIKQFLGNNEARYRRYKANCAVCRADDGAATALSSSGASKDLYGTQSIGFYGKIRSWKSVAVLQMLEKQMGPESFCKILKNIVAPPKGIAHPLRTLSTKEFRHLANEVGNLERPFLREFFPRWVASSGCPVLKMGFSYNKRKNMVELAVLRGCTATPDSVAVVANGNPDSVKRESDVGWPGMMSIRVHELDGMYDHPVLPMAGETWQLLEIQCHSKLAAKRFQKPKKGPKHDGSDDNVDMAPPVDMRSNVDSPLLWLRADPETEYLAEIHFNQPVQMWINQLEKDRDVVAQTQAITALEYFPRLLSVVNALSSLLGDSQAFWRVRVEAAFALAVTASEETDWAGLLHLIKFYKSRRFDTKIGLPKPNDFHDFAEYFVLEAIPHAIALVRASDMKSPREAIEFILQLLKYNENTGNPYSDVFWLSALLQAIGELEFGQQTVPLLSSLLKRIDRLLQFDRLMPSYNGILTISCIRVLTQIALKLSEFFPLERVMDLIKPFCSPKTNWQVRIEAARALLDLEFHGKGIDAALILFIRYLEEEVSLRGQVKLAVHAMRLCQIRDGSEADSDVASETLVALLRLLESSVAFNNVVLRHYLFCILQVLAGRPPTLCGVPRDEILQMGHAETCSELKNIFAALVKQSKPLDPSLENLMLPYDGSLIPVTNREHDVVSNGNEGSHPVSYIPEVVALPESPAEENFNGHEESQQHTAQPNFTLSEPPREADAFSNSHEQKITEVPLEVDIVSNSHELIEPEVPREADVVYHDQKKPEEAPRELDYVDHEQKKPDHSVRRADTASNSNECRKPEEAPRGADTISNSQGRKKPVLKIRVKQSSASSRAEDATVERSQGPQNGPDRAASSSVSIEAPQRNFTETVSINNQNQNLEDVNSCHDVGSRVTASIGSVKLTGDTEELLKELQCTADSSKVLSALPPADQSNNADSVSRKFISLQSLAQKDQDSGSLARKREKEKKKDKRKDKEKHKKRDRDDPAYLERKRLKKEKGRGKLQSGVVVAASIDLKRQKLNSETKMSMIREESKVSPMVLDGKRDDTVPVTRVTSVQIRLGEPGGPKDVIQKMDTSSYNISDDSKKMDTNTNASEGTSSRRFKIKIKNRTLNKS